MQMLLENLTEPHKRLELIGGLLIQLLIFLRLKQLPQTLIKRRHFRLPLMHRPPPLILCNQYTFLPHT